MYFYIKDIKSPRRVLEHRKFLVRGVRKSCPKLDPKNEVSCKNPQLFQIKTTDEEDAVKIYLAHTEQCLVAQTVPNKNGVSVMLEKERDRPKTDPKYYCSYWVLENRNFIEGEENKNGNSNSASSNSSSNSRNSESRSQLSGASSSSNSLTSSSSTSRASNQNSTCSESQTRNSNSNSQDLNFHYVIKSFKNRDFVFDLTNWRLCLNKFNVEVPGQFFLLQNEKDAGPVDEDPEDDNESSRLRINNIIEQCQDLTLNGNYDVLTAIIFQLREEGATIENLNDTRRILSREFLSSRFHENRFDHVTDPDDESSDVSDDDGRDGFDDYDEDGYYDSMYHSYLR